MALSAKPKMCSNGLEYLVRTRAREKNLYQRLPRTDPLGIILDLFSARPDVGITSSKK